MFIIKRLIKWGLVTFAILMIGVAVLGVINKDQSGTEALKKTLGVTDEGILGKSIDAAGSANDYLTSDEFKGKVQSGIDYAKSGQLQSDVQNIAEKAGQVAEEQGLKEKATKAGEGFLGALKNSLNWFIENGQSVK